LFYNVFIVAVGNLNFLRSSLTTPLFIFLMI